MLTEFRYTLGRFRGQILGWGLGIAALGLILVPFYDIFMERQGEFLQMIESYPPELLAFFGADAAAMATPEGYLTMYGFSLLPIIAGIFALIAGSGLLASDEESGRLDLIVAHPVSRCGIFWGRVLGLLAATVALLVLGWLGFVILLGTSSLDVAAGRMALPFLAVLAQALLYSALALLLGLLLPARRLAAMVAGLVMVAGYLLSSLMGLHDVVANLARLFPYAYFQGGEAINGLDWAAFLGLVGVGAALVLISWWRFERRDIRVAGEGNWRLPLPRGRRKAEAT